METGLEIIAVEGEHRIDSRLVAESFQYVNTFAKWLWGDYFSKNFPAYQQYRARRIAPPAQRHLLSGKKGH
jgi:hypothetical protein